MYYLGHLHKDGYKWQEAYRVAMILTAATFIYQYFHMQQGDWLLYTITFIYMGGTINGLALQRALKRFYAAPVGFYCGFLFFGLLSYFDYRYIYLLPIFGAIAFWYLFLTGEYAGFVVFFMLFFMMFYDLNSQEYNDFNLFNLVIARIIATLIAGLMIIAGELLIYPGASSAITDARRSLERIFRELGLAVESINEHCRKHLSMSHEYWSRLSYINAKIEQLHIIVNSYRCEPDADSTIVTALDDLCAELMKIYEGVRLLELSCNHPGQQPTEAEITAAQELATRLQTMIASSVPITASSAIINPDRDYALALHKISDGITTAVRQLPAVLR